MLKVIELEEARRIVSGRFCLKGAVEQVGLSGACGRIMAQPVVAPEGVPPFDRSTVDGYAVQAADTFGSSDALPALLRLAGEVQMGAEPDVACEAGTCVRIPTGGMVPAGADAVVMLEHCEDYGDGTIGVARAVAPGDSIVFAHDDVKPGQELIGEGALLRPHHIGTLASLGMVSVPVRTRLRVGIISTGDEIVEAAAEPVASQMRDVNAPMLAAAVAACGALPERLGIVVDEYEALLAAVRNARANCDMVLVSGGSSAGSKDNTARVLSTLGELLFHGVAVKPGKPTMCADLAGVPAFGLPGHPVAAYFMFLELAAPLLGEAARPHVQARLVEGVPSNHGRAELVAARLEPGADGVALAWPVRGKSGLISQVSGTNGYFAIGRNQEGLAAGAPVTVRLF